MTAPISAHDVARELRARLSGDDAQKKKKLHKLLYYCQAWYLAWTGQLLFREEIVAWKMGPVVRDVWVHERHRPGDPVPPPLELVGDQRSIVDYVLERYGSFTGGALEEMTHREAPWQEAWPDGTITAEAMRSYFRRDDQFIRRQAKVEELRRRDDIYSLDPGPLSDDALAAVARAVAGEYVFEL